MTIVEHADMSKYTSFKAGGTAEKLVIVETAEELLELLNEIKEKGEKDVFLGNGSNTIFLDGEYRGTVIKAGEDFETIGLIPLADCGFCSDCDTAPDCDGSLECHALTAGSATLLSKLARAAAAVADEVRAADAENLKPENIMDLDGTDTAEFPRIKREEKPVTAEAPAAPEAVLPESAAAENPVPEKALPAKPRSRRKPGSRPAEKTSAD